MVREPAIFAETSELLIRRRMTAFEVVDPVTQLFNREVNPTAITKANKMRRFNVAVHDALLIMRVALQYPRCMRCY